MLKSIFCYAHNPIITLANLMNFCMYVVQPLGCHVKYLLKCRSDHVYLNSDVIW